MFRAQAGVWKPDVVGRLLKDEKSSFVSAEHNLRVKNS
jgi:hypothetical protein